MQLLRSFLNQPGNGCHPFRPEKAPGERTDVDFTGIETEKILDFGPIGGFQIVEERIMSFSANRTRSARK